MSVGLNDVLIVGAARTPMGALKGSLSSLTGPKLCALTVKEALVRSQLSREHVDALYLGCTLPAGLGQAPARDVACFAGLPSLTSCSLLNDGAVSGMKAIILGIQSLQLGETSVVLAGGFESVSNVPFYMERKEPKFGGTILSDGITRDYLMDATTQSHVAEAGEDRASKMQISKLTQDIYAADSYKRALQGYADGTLQDEVFTVDLVQPDSTRAHGRMPSATRVNKDEELTKCGNFMSRLHEERPILEMDSSSITTCNSAKLADGAAITVLATSKMAKELKCNPMAKVVGYAEASVKPMDNTLAPMVACNKVLSKLNMTHEEVDLWEINEDLSCTVLVSQKMANLNPEKVNIQGGSISIGQAVGAVGSRITNRKAITRLRLL